MSGYNGWATIRLWSPWNLVLTVVIGFFPLVFVFESDPVVRILAGFGLLGAVRAAVTGVTLRKETMIIRRIYWTLRIRRSEIVAVDAELIDGGSLNRPTWAPVVRLHGRKRPLKIRSLAGYGRSWDGPPNIKVQHRVELIRRFAGLGGA